MKWYLNDASLQGQFTGRTDVFLKTFDKLLIVRNRYQIFKENFYIIEGLWNIRIQENVNLLDTLHSEKRREYTDIKSAILRLLASSTSIEKLGEDTQMQYLYKNNDVSDTAIALTIKDIRKNIGCALFSFLGGRIDYGFDQLDIQLINPGQDPEPYQVDNFFEIYKLEDNIKSILPNDSWEDLHHLIKVEFANLELKYDAFEKILNHPYNNVFKNKIFELLSVLNEYMNNRPDGMNNELANQLVHDNFGDGKRFSDESESNKREYGRELTFENIHGKNVFAPYHGKFSLLKNEYRMHFEWPIKGSKQKMEVFYIGPKITTK